MTGRARRERAIREVERTIPAPSTGRFNQQRREQEARAAHEALHSAVEMARNYHNDPSIQAVRQKAVDAYHRAQEAAYPPGFWEDVAKVRAGDAAGLETVIRFLEADPYFFGSGHVKENLLRYLKKFTFSPADRTRLEAVIVSVVRRHNHAEFTEYRRLARHLDSPALRTQLAECLQSDDQAVSWRARWMVAGIDGDQESPAVDLTRRMRGR